jgi:ribosomal protein S10
MKYKIRKHEKSTLTIHLKSKSKETLDLYKDFIKKLLNNLNINHSIFFLPISKKRITLLKSPHVNKKAKEHFFLKEYKAILTLNISLSKQILNHILLNKPQIISFKLVYIEG